MDVTVDASLSSLTQQHDTSGHKTENGKINIECSVKSDWYVNDELVNKWEGKGYP